MRQKISNILKVFALLVLSIQCKAQEFEWVKFFGGSQTQWPVSMSADPSGNQYAIINFDDEIKLDTITLKDSGNYNWKPMVVKQNAAGKVMWYKTIRPANKTHIYGLASRFNSKGNLIFYIASPVDIIIGADTIKRKGTGNFTLYMIEFDPGGKMLNGKNIIEGVMNYGYLNFSSNLFTCDNYNNLYFTLIYSGQIKIYDSTGVTNFGSSSSKVDRNIIFKFSESGQKFEWAKELPFGKNENVWINSLKVDIHQNVYASGYLVGNDTFLFKGKKIINPQTNTGAMFIWDKYGNDKNWFHMLASGKKSTFSDIAVHDSNSIFVSGTYLGDSAKFENTWKRNNKYGGYQFFARYDINGKLKWVKTEDTTYKTTILLNSQLGSMINYEDKYFYRSYYETVPNKPVIFDGQKYNGLMGMHMKLDERGNVLWGFRTYLPFMSMATDAYNNFYFQGWGFGDTIKFGNFKIYPNQYDAYIGKTFDYAIIRGDVKKGPFCAGDSLFIPYTKIGNYADTNIFFAEISDEFGNFTGKEREIGRLKTKDSGTIRGVLPMFKVASSGKYRIRIRSTSPQAQSYYKFDSLRLLIYSRDKADPGPTETICYGDSFQLSTYGGTKWKWSPKYNMTDSNLRQPWVWPAKTTTYKIIIADSSGCGAPDTAYKKIVLRKPLKLTLAYNDTTVCDTSILKIPMKFEGGDSTNYHWQAYSVLSSKSWQKTNSGKLKLKDTLFHIPKVSITASQKLAIVLDDQCTNKKDTAYVNISLLKPEKLATKFKDTTLCIGNTISWKAKPVYGLTKNSVWEWRDITNDKVLSSNDSLNLTANKTTKIKLILSNGCTIDSNVFTLNVNPPLKANILIDRVNLNDTTLCLGHSLKLDANGKYGDSTNYKFKWYLNTDLISIADSFTLNSSSHFKRGGEKKILKLVLDDNCTSFDDSISTIITVLSSPKADFSYGTACNLTPLQFTFTGSIPSPPITTSFYWNFNGESSSTIENPYKLYSKTGSKLTILTLTSSNGCSEEIVKDIDVKLQSKADFTTNDVCENDSALFLNKSQDATSYNWTLGDGQKSNLKNIKHKYQNGINPKTYFVKLVALLKDGCADSITKTISVLESPKADFSYGIVCNFRNIDFKFTGSKPLSPVTTAFKWNFNNEDSSTLENPSRLFSTPGTKILTLTLTSNNGCKNEISKQIAVKIQSKADFDLKDVCENDSAILINKSQDATSYKWDFGDGVISNFKSIKHKYPIGGNPKTFDVKLIAIVKDGCSDSLIKTIHVLESPKADFSHGLLCNLITTDFKFTGSIPKYPVTSTINWNFNNEATSSIDTPFHLFSTPGNKTLTLILASSNGCTDTLIKTIEIKAKSKADFISNDVCENDSVVFVNKSKDATGYTWKFGDGENSALENPKHKYSITTSTTFNVTLVALVTNGCSDSTVKQVTINENPKSDFTYTNTSGKVDFKATQTGAKNYRWLFGNGDSANISNPNYSYTYKKTALYNVCLKIINTAGCQSQTCKQLSITGGVSTLSKPSGFKIYPNPNTGNFTVEIDNSLNDGSIEVFNIIGERVEKVEKLGKVTTLDLDVANGIYLVKVKNGNMIWNQKIIVNN